MKDEIKIPDLLLERFLLGEVTKTEEEWIRKRIKEDKDLKERLDLLMSSDREISEKYPVAGMAARIRAQYEKSLLEEVAKETGGLRDEVRTPAWKFVLPGLAFIFIAFLIVPALYKEHPRPMIQTTIKGSSQLFIYRQKGRRNEILKNNDMAREGDVVQLAYVADRTGYGVIFSLDGRGNLTLHYPYGRKQATDLVQGKPCLLKESYKLDDAPRFETFFFVSSYQRISAEDVLKKAEGLRSQPDRAIEKSRDLFKPLNVIVFTLRKG